MGSRFVDLSACRYRCAFAGIGLRGNVKLCVLLRLALIAALNTLSAFTPVAAAAATASFTFTTCADSTIRNILLDIGIALRALLLLRALTAIFTRLAGLTRLTRLA